MRAVLYDTVKYSMGPLTGLLIGSQHTDSVPWVFNGVAFALK